MKEFFRQDDGSSIVETALLMPVFVLLLVVAVDLGRAYYAAIEVSSSAYAGAMYGVQNPTDTSGMAAAAKLDAANVSNLSLVANYGCECSNSSSGVASCSTAPTCTYNVVNYVEVTTTASYVPLLPYPGFSDAFTLKGYARVRSAHQ